MSAALKASAASAINTFLLALPICSNNLTQGGGFLNPANGLKGVMALLCVMEGNRVSRLGNPFTRVDANGIPILNS